MLFKRPRGKMQKGVPDHTIQQVDSIVFLLNLTQALRQRGQIRQRIRQRNRRE